MRIVNAAANAAGKPDVDDELEPETGAVSVVGASLLKVALQPGRSRQV